AGTRRNLQRGRGRRGVRDGVLVDTRVHHRRDRPLLHPLPRRAPRPFWGGRGNPVSGRGARHGERRMTTTETPSRAAAVATVGNAFKRAMVAVGRLRGRETHRPGKPSFAHYQLMFALSDRDGLSSSELAHAADLSPATVTQMLDSLVDHGLVTRLRSEK